MTKINATLLSTAAQSEPRDDSPGDQCSGMAWRAAASDCTLLLTGETGTGKGYLARWIHDKSRRASGPFVPVNCGAIPESLIDSHLFGHAKGAFSGAGNDHVGLVRAANGGTLLLDEITELPASAQMRLLRLLEEREVQPVGFSRPVKVDVRIIAATNGNVHDAVQSGKLRQDLYFRLDIVHLHLRPLRHRVAEIPRLCALFNAEFATLYRQPKVEFDRAALRVLEQYAWPGNIRELRTLVERLHVLCGGRRISLDDLRQHGQLRLANGSRTHATPQRLQELKFEVVSEALSAASGNVSRAAINLGVHRSTIYRWLAERQAV